MAYMEVIPIQRGTAHYPPELERMHKPPPVIYCRGDLVALMQRPRVAIVGSRLMSNYGRQVTSRLARELAAAGVVIISGLALGVDAAAHRAALEAASLTMAVLPSPVTAIAPATNHRLAQRIVEQGGALLSSYAPGEQNHKGNFVARNEIVAALCDVLLVTEAAAKSGTLHTVDFAHAMGREVCAVPGNITSRLSAGTNQLIAAGHAAAITSAADIFRRLDMQRPQQHKITGSNPAQQRLLDLLQQGVADGDALLQASGQTVSIFNQTLTMLEIAGSIVPLGGNQWGLA